MTYDRRFLRAVSALLAVTAGCLATAGTTLAQDTRFVAGTLTCRGQGSVGFILGSTEELSCLYQVAGGSRQHEYAGRVQKVGLDIGVKGPSVIVWTVLGSSREMSGEALTGTYGGVSAEASVAVGVGANALIGGSNNSIVLQPLSVQAQQGINLAVGIAEISLDYLPR